MKKITRLFLLAMVAILFIAAPVGLALPHIMAATDKEDHPYLPVGQARAPFSQQQVTVADISDWTANVNVSSGIAQSTGTADFTNTVSNLGLSKNPYLKYSPTWASSGERDKVAMIAQKRPNMVEGNFTQATISLPENGYYVLSVDYYILGRAESGYFTLVNSKTPTDKNKSVKLSKQYVGNAHPSQEYEYAYTEWTYTYTEYTYTDADDTDGIDPEIVDVVKKDPIPDGYQLGSSVTKSVTTRDQYSNSGKHNLQISLGGVDTPFEFDDLDDVKAKGFTPKNTDGTGTKKTRSITVENPANPTELDGFADLGNPATVTEIGGKYNGYTLTKITDLTELKSYWQTAYFFVKTDMLEAATMSAIVGAKLGGNNQYNGAAYFDNFECWSVTPAVFNAKYDEVKFKWKEKIDLTSTHIENEDNNGGEYPQSVWYDDNGVQALRYSDYFQPASKLTGAHIAELDIPNTAVPSRLRLDSKTNYFHTENGDNHGVMLVASTLTYSGIITKKEHNLRPKAHEIYMIQFYLTGAATSYNFRIGNEYKAITARAYPYHNLWQLCTFFVTGDAIADTSEDGIVLGFYVGSPDTAAADTGWMAVDGFKITRVSGSYAAANAGDGSVQLNTRTDSTSPTNAYFDKGTAADIYVNGRFNTKYPYPLQATGWTAGTVAGVQNGIMNTKHAVFGDTPNPGQISGKNIDNNVYMMRNFNAVTNTVSAPSTFSTTANGTTYISFHAQTRDIARNDAVAKKADIIVRYTDPANENKKIELGRISVPENTDWKRYELGIKEGQFAVAHTVELVFEITDSSMAFFVDNVSISTTADQSAVVKKTFTVDPLTTVGAWTSETQFYDGTAGSGTRADGGVLLENQNGEFTTLTNAFTFSAEATSYYKFTATLRGDTDYAHLYVGGFNGQLSVTKNAINAYDALAQLTTYTMYLYNETAMELVFKIDLGNNDPDDDNDENIAPARIYITKLELTKMTDSTEYDEYKAKWDAYDDDDEEEEDRDPTFAVLTLQSTEETPAPAAPGTSTSEGANDFFGRNWWYLIPTLITAIAIVVGVGGFLFRKLKFNRHITRKGTSYARDIRIEEARKNITAVKAVKQEVDKTDKTIDNNITDDKDETK